jgi:tape measure domain-containing protein
VATTRTIIFEFKTTGVNIADQMRQADTAVNNTQSNISKQSGIIAGKMGGIGASMQRAGTMATVGLSLPLIAAAKSGIEYNAQMEQYAASFATMLGDDAKAAEYLLKLKEMAAKTPFEMTDLADSAKTLMAFGRTAEQTTGDMQMLGDISQGDAQKFGSLTNAFGKMASSGKMTGEELNMMIDAGFNPLTSMAEKSGKSMADLRKEMEGGNISFEMVQESMKSATSEGGMFFGSMDKQSKTLNGQLSTLKDTFMTALGDAIMPLTKWIKDVLVPKMTELIGKFQALSPGVKKAIGIFALIAVALGPGLLIVGTFLRLFTPLLKIIKIVGVAFKVLRIIMMSSFGPVVLAIMAVIAIVILVIKYWDQIKAVAIKVGKAVMGVFTAIGDWIAKVWKSIWDAVVKFFTPIIDFFKNVFIIIVAVIAIAIQWIYDLFKGVATWVYDNVLMPIYNFFKGIFEAVYGVVSGVITRILAGLAVIGTWIYLNVLLPIFNFFSGVFNSIWGVISGVIDKIKNAFRVVKDFIITVFNSVRDTISNIFSTIGNILKVPINAIINSINGVLKGINKIKVPDWVPGIGGKHANFGMIPTLAKGGVVNSATQAIIGEAGPEAVVPLNRKSIGNFVSGIGLKQAGQNITIKIPQQSVALVDLNGNKLGNILLPGMMRSLKLGGALT